MSARRAFVFSREYPPITVGGTSTVARNAAVGLTTDGWTVTVITTRPGHRQDRCEQIDGVAVHRVGTAAVYHAESGLDDQTVRVHRRLHATAHDLALRTGAPDVVILPDLFCYPEAALLSQRHGAPLINILLQDFRAITPYDRDKHRVASGVAADRQHLLELERKAVEHSDHTVFISQALSDAVTSYYPASRAPRSVIHLGVDLEEIAAVAADPGARQRREELLATVPGRRLVVAVGRLVPVKGYAQLLTAFARLAAAAPVHLALIGTGPEETALRTLARQLGVSHQVTFLGDIPRAEALGWMSVADIAAVPSLWESFCYVCAEMMAFARPVVCTAVDSLRELVPDVSCGYPVPVHGPSGNRQLDPDHLAQALRQALAAPEEAARRGRAAQARIAARFTNSRFAEGLSRLAGSLLAETAHAGFGAPAPEHQRHDLREGKST
jgi:glycosyltransferase involved in cell wall biosynthesis